jgi:uncharacterized protein
MANGPIRTCVGCRRSRPQGEFVRVVRRPGGGVELDASSALGRPTGDARAGVRAAGRGAYLCPEQRCVDRAMRSGGLRRALRYEGPSLEGLRQELQELMDEITGLEARGEEGRHG